jgi:hypothetical protein
MTINNRVRVWITKRLIRLAMKTCVQGFCYDHLEEAYESESV